MIDGIIRGLLGGLVPVYDYIMTHPVLVTLIFAVLVGLYLAGLFQLKHIEKMTRELVIALSPDLIKAKPHITSSGIYKHILPRWESELKKWHVYFIPHRLDIWPVPATAKNIISKMDFTPDWIKNVLQEENFLLDEFSNK